MHVLPVDAIAVSDQETRDLLDRAGNDDLDHRTRSHENRGKSCTVNMDRVLGRHSGKAEPEALTESEWGAQRTQATGGHHGNYTPTARALGIAVSTLRTYLEGP